MKTWGSSSPPLQSGQGDNEMLMLCERDCTGNPIVNGQKVHKAYQRGRLYEIDPEDCWAIHFRSVSSEEIAAIENRSEGPAPQYLESKTRAAEVDDLFDKFKI
jgi:hypothetical protein